MAAAAADYLALVRTALTRPVIAPTGAGTVAQRNAADERENLEIDDIDKLVKNRKAQKFSFMPTDSIIKLKINETGTDNETCVRMRADLKYFTQAITVIARKYGLDPLVGTNAAPNYDLGAPRGPADNMACTLAQRRSANQEFYMLLEYMTEGLANDTVKEHVDDGVAALRALRIKHAENMTSEQERIINWIANQSIPENSNPNLFIRKINILFGLHDSYGANALSDSTKRDKLKHTLIGVKTYKIILDWVTMHPTEYQALSLTDLKSRITNAFINQVDNNNMNTDAPMSNTVEDDDDELAPDIHGNVYPHCFCVKGCGKRGHRDYYCPELNKSSDNAASNQSTKFANNSEFCEHMSKYKDSNELINYLINALSS